MKNLVKVFCVLLFMSYGCSKDNGEDIFDQPEKLGNIMNNGWSCTDIQPMLSSLHLIGDHNSDRALQFRNSSVTCNYYSYSTDLNIIYFLYSKEHKQEVLEITNGSSPYSNCGRPQYIGESNKYIFIQFTCSNNPCYSDQTKEALKKLSDFLKEKLDNCQL